MILTRRECEFREVKIGDTIIALPEIIRIVIKEYGYVDSIFFEDGDIITTTMPIRISYRERKKS